MNLFDPELKLINTKPVIKNNLKELLSELKKFKVPAILVLDYSKRNDSVITEHAKTSHKLSKTMRQAK